MTRKTRIIISLVLVLVAFVAGIAVFAQSEKDHKAQADGTATTRYTVDANGKIEPPPTSTTAAKGTADNPFFILEIVPYEGMGTIGYHIAGCEPINMQKAAYDKASIPGESHLYTAGATRTEYLWKTTETMPSYYPDSPTVVTDVPQYGTMKYVEDGTGNYNMKTDPAPNYLYPEAPADYEGTRYKYVDGVPTEADDGNLMRLVQAGTAKYEPVTEGTGGNYLWTPLDAQTCSEMTSSEAAEYRKDYNERGEFKTYLEGVQCYKVEGIKTYIHKNIFLKESVGLAYEMRNGERKPYQEAEGKPTLEERIANYKSVVYTVTPEDLNIVSDGVLVNKALIERADLISISSHDSTGTAIETYEKYKGYNNTSYTDSGLKCELNRKIMDGTDVKTTFNDNPLDWPAALEIYKRATSTTDPLPVIWDTNTFDNFSDTFRDVTLKCDISDGKGNVNVTINDKGSQDNLYKLFLMLYMMKTSVFESFFGSPSSFSTASYSQTFSINDTTNVTKNFTTPLLSDYKDDAKRYWTNQTLYPWKSGLLPNRSSLDDGANVAILDTLGIMNNGGPSLFQYSTVRNLVRNGIYTYNGNTFLTTGIADATDVKNDQYGWEVYEFFEGINDPQSDLSTAEVLYYLLNGLEDGPGARNEHKYKILELQPATSYKGGTTSGTVTNDAFWNAFIAMYANTTKPATVVRMSTSEFIGKQVECVSEYDLVYVGVNTLSSNWSMDFSGTDFIYAHSGPIIYTNRAGMQGWLGITSTPAPAGAPGDRPAPGGGAPAGGGGDPAGGGGAPAGGGGGGGWTPVPTPVLIDNAEGNYPLSGNDLTKLAEQKLIEYVQSGAPVLFGTNFFTDANASDVASNIDRNSNVYDFAKNKVGSPIYEYALSQSSTRYATETALRNGLAKSRRVEMEFSVTPIPYDETKTSDSEKYLSGNTLTFKFKVHAPAGMKYLVALYVDTNGDGVFTVDERMSGVSTRLDGGGETGRIVEAGKTYVVTKYVTDRKGAVAWKLDLVNTDDFYPSTAPAIEKRIVHASLSGLSAIKATEKEPLRILQIIMPPDADSDDERENVLMLPEPGETGLSSIQQKFKNWTSDINGLELTFKRMLESDLMTLLESNSRYLLNNYEMIILGFGDCYNGVVEEETLDAIAEFTAAGKAVLFTHDASSMVGPDPYDAWGKELTLAFRDRYGMDRYDVSDQKGSTAPVSAGLRADYPLVTTSDSSAINDLLIRDGYALAQGLTNGHVYRWTQLDNNLVSKKVTKINSGAITQYPYLIPDSIEVARTHPQYYQLDLENENLTVWYCLTGSGDYDDEDDKNRIKNYYNATSNDVRNNYYIYNYGNITYSGMGHIGDMSDDEIKLFINTFVAAYRAAAKPVQIVVTNEDSTRNVTSGDYYVNVEVDSSNSAALLGGEDMGVQSSYRLQEADGTGFKEVDPAVTAVSKRVEFRIEENTSVGGTPVYELKFYMEDATGALTELTNFAVYRKSDGEFMSTKTSSTKFDADPEDIYYVDVPMKLETVDGKTAVTATKVKAEVKKTFYIGTQETIVTGETMINIIPRGLFDLD